MSYEIVCTAADVVPLIELKSDEEKLEMIENQPADDVWVIMVALFAMLRMNADDWVKAFCPHLMSNHNNPHHIEADGALWGHLYLMAVALEAIRHSLSDVEAKLLALAIFWHDLGKYETTCVEYQWKNKKQGIYKLDEDGNKIPKKTYPEEAGPTLYGKPMMMAYKHVPKGLEILDENSDLFTDEEHKIVRFLVEHHMKPRALQQQLDAGKDLTIPDWLKPMVEGLEAWDWPDFDDLDPKQNPDSLIEEDVWHAANLNQSTYTWMAIFNCELLRIFFAIDGAGRIKAHYVE